MKPGEAFVVKFDAKSRRHLQYTETVQSYHDLLKNELADIPINVEKNVDDFNEISSLETILESLEEKHKEKEKKMEVLEVPRIPGRVVSKRRFNEDDDDEELEQFKKKKIPENMQETIERFPQFFQTALKSGRVSIQVPNGWIGALGNALNAFDRTGLEIDICNLFVGSEGGLCLGMSHSSSVSILDGFLEVTSQLCPICGNELQNKARMCKKCTEEFEIFAPRK